LTNVLRLALDRGELQVWLQPIVDLASGRVAKAEALLRWQHPVRGMVPPDVFIPIAEETGLIVEIGDWVFRQAAAAAKRWLDQRGGAPCQVSINVSPRQFSHGVPADHWIGILQQLGLPAHSVVIEITEGLLLADRAGIMDKLAHLRAAGMELALDDFGTGYSAMAYLKKFNIDYLKIDRSFVRDLDTDPSDRAIAEAIVVMARKLGLKTIAEGVETPEQRNLLASVGCDMVQGYLYARPLPATEFLAAQAAVAA
jgi:EAL domain-containing protein (putative c-di-GMP-specific phosphodiesterase class I)